MVDKFVSKVKDLFTQVKSSESVQKTVESAKATASDLGESAQKLAGEAADKAKATAHGVGDRAKAEASDLADRAKARAHSDDIESGPASTAETASGKVKQAAGNATSKAEGASDDLASAADHVVERSRSNVTPD